MNVPALTSFEHSLFKVYNNKKTYSVIISLQAIVTHMKNLMDGHTHKDVCLGGTHETLFSFEIR